MNAEHDVVEGESDLGVDDAGDQYLTFIMNDEEYGVDILSVQEIRGWESPTPIPNAPSHIKGVINLRGTIVPLVDLRQLFGIESVEYSAVTVVIVLKVVTDRGVRITGIIVDAVSDVYSLSAEDMREAPDLGSRVDASYIKGLASVGEKMVILLETREFLTLDDVPELNDMPKSDAVAS